MKVTCTYFPMSESYNSYTLNDFLKPNNLDLKSVFLVNMNS